MKTTLPTTAEEFHGNDRAEVIAWIEGTATYLPGDSRGLKATNNTDTNGGIGAVWGFVPEEPALMFVETAETRLTSAVFEVDSCRSLFERLLESKGGDQEELIIAEVGELLSQPITAFEAAVDGLLARILELESTADDIEWEFMVREAFGGDE